MYDELKTINTNDSNNEKSLKTLNNHAPNHIVKQKISPTTLKTPLFIIKAIKYKHSKCYYLKDVYIDHVIFRPSKYSFQIQKHQFPI